VIYCSPAAIREVPTGQCHVALLIGNINMKYKHATAKFFLQMPILHSNCESFQLKSFAVHSSMWNTVYPEIFTVYNFHGFHGRSSNRKNLVRENC